MANSTNEPSSNLLVAVCRIHFLYALVLAVQIILYYAWQLITPQAVLARWVVTAIFLVVVASVWYLAKRDSSEAATRRLTFALVMADIGLASSNVYMQRGMAARAVALYAVLYAVPLIVASILASRSALLITAVACMAAYTTTALAYFVLNFNEGLKIELYGEVGFYCALFFISAWLLRAIRSRST
jgi:hypothetical protein